MAQFAGARTIAQGITEDRLIRAVDDQIAYLDPNEAPLITMLTISQKMRKGVGNSKTEWIEDDYVAQWDSVAVAALVGDTNITVADGTKFSINDLVLVPKVVSSSAAPEVMRVTAKPSTNVITVTRGFAGSTAAAIALNDPIRIIGSAFSENADRGTPKNTTKVTAYNTMQIFRTPFSVSRSMMQSAAYGTPVGEWNEELRKRLIEHKREMNSAFLFGRQSDATVGGVRLRTCNGVNSVVSSNVTDAGGTLTEKTFDAFLESAFRYGSRKKLGVFAPRIMRAVHAWAKSKLHLTETVTSYGMSLVNLVTPFGTLILANDWMLENPSGSTAGFAGWGFVIDPENTSYRYLNGNGNLGNSDTKLIELMPDKNLATDGAYGEYITESCPAYKVEKTHAKIFNVTDYS